MLRDATIVCIAGIDWSFSWQVPQEVAEALGAGGNDVLFVENTGVRSPRIRDLARIVDRARRWRSSYGRPVEVRPNVEVLSPVLIPLPYSRAATRVNAAVLGRRVRRVISTRRPGPVVVITFLPTPLVRALLARLEPDLVVYYAADRLSESSPGARRLREHERHLLAEADLVLTTSEALRHAVADDAPEAEVLAAGVRAGLIRDERDAALAADGQPTQTVGFSGSIRDELDIALLRAVAIEAPDLRFRLVGPVFADASTLASLPNVQLVGAMNHDALVREMVRFSIGILPYRQNAYTAHIMPMKLKEYLAAGLPVVSTSLPEVRRFADEHPTCTIRFADDVASFVAALREALAEDRGASASRYDVARSYDWSAQVGLLNGRLAGALAEREASRASVL